MPRDVTVIPRVLLSTAVGVVHAVESTMGAGPATTASGNAWAAVCADRARAAERERLHLTLCRSDRPGAARPGRQAAGEQGPSARRRVPVDRGHGPSARRG